MKKFPELKEPLYINEWSVHKPRSDNNLGFTPNQLEEIILEKTSLSKDVISCILKFYQPIYVRSTDLVIDCGTMELSSESKDYDYFIKKEDEIQTIIIDGIMADADYTIVDMFGSDGWGNDKDEIRNLYKFLLPNKNFIRICYDEGYSSPILSAIPRRDKDVEYLKKIKIPILLSEDQWTRYSVLHGVIMKGGVSKQTILKFLSFIDDLRFINYITEIYYYEKKIVYVEFEK